MGVADSAWLEGEAAERLLPELVTLQEAALLAHIAASGIDTTITRLHRNDMAVSLCALLTVYAVSDDRRRIRQVSAAELRGGVFSDGGGTVHFRDGRLPITGLAVTRTALKAAVHALKDARKR
jgi:hypothetical protein